MIRFGSRTELYLPLDSQITVERGDRVAGGETIIARLAARGDLVGRAPAIHQELKEAL
jgi:hypothetical protein